MTDEEIQQALNTLPDWRQIKGQQKITRKYLFDSWRDSLIFVEWVFYRGELTNLEPRAAMVGRWVSVRIGPVAPARLRPEDFDLARSLSPCDGRGGPSPTTATPPLRAESAPSARRVLFLEP